jgi:CheY-like chemotaxis protein
MATEKDSGKQPADVIWLLEDDHLQADALAEHLRGNHRGAVLQISSEAQFLSNLQKAFGQNVQPRPRLVIADVMLPWCFIGERIEGVEPDPEVNTRHGFRNAGVRCWRQLRQWEKKRNVRRTPFVFHTVLRSEEFGFEMNSDNQTAYVSKDQPPEVLDAQIKHVSEDWTESELT